LQAAAKQEGGEEWYEILFHFVVGLNLGCNITEKFWRNDLPTSNVEYRTILSEIPTG